MVERLILFNWDGDEEEVLAMVEEARRVLLEIPGVCGLAFGRALAPGTRYRYWLSLRFRGAEVVPFYRDHPTHQRFANQVFRPKAKDRLTTDFEVLEEVPCGS